MIRVLHIVPGKVFGGVENTLVTIARFRDLCPAMVSEFAVCFQSRLSQELDSLGVPVHILGEVRVRSPLTVWRARRRLRDLLRRERFDVVVCHMPWVQAIFGPVARSKGVALAFRVHGPSDGRHWTERWAALTRPDLAVCVSQFVATDLARIYPNTPTEVVYNPVPPVKLLDRPGRLAVRAEVNTSEDAVVIIQACRLEPGKGHRVCLDALGLLRDLPDWECWQIGGPQRSSEHKYFEGLRERATRLGIEERVHFWGQRSDVPRLLAAADIYCQPNDTFSEGFGIVFLEAMRAGLPVVTTRIGAASEVVDDRCGFLLSPGNVSATSVTLERLIRDPALRTKLAVGGLLRADAEFGPAIQIPRLCKALCKAIPGFRIPSDFEQRLPKEKLSKADSVSSARAFRSD